MIPKIIHYCWFGKNPLPEQVLIFIKTWKKFHPDYELKLWDESNFPINNFPYAEMAYKMKKYAFVSDVCRFYALYNHGGLYLDTDVEVLQSFEDLLDNTAIGGFEQFKDPASKKDIYNFQAAVLGSIKEGLFSKDILKYYENINIEKEGLQTINSIIEKIMKPKKIKFDNSYQNIEGYICLYPSEFFSAKNYITKKISITNNTYSIHHFDATWITRKDKVKSKLKQLLISLLGNKTSDRIRIIYKNIINE